MRIKIWTYFLLIVIGQAVFAGDFSFNDVWAEITETHCSVGSEERMPEKNKQDSKNHAPDDFKMAEQVFSCGLSLNGILTCFAAFNFLNLSTEVSVPPPERV